MTSDESLEELHAFGERIGLKRAWYRNGKHPHYGIVDSFRRVAIEQGAREASMREIVAAAARIRRGDEGERNTDSLPEKQGRQLLSVVLP
jgi:hypothetical protein